MGVHFKFLLANVITKLLPSCMAQCILIRRRQHVRYVSIYLADHTASHNRRR